MVLMVLCPIKNQVMSIIQTIISKAFHTATLIHKEQITPSTYHIRIKLKDNSFKNYIPGQQLRVLVGLDNIASLSNLVRTYSVWYYDELKNEADLAICTFFNGQGAKWVQSIAPGDTIYFRDPEGKFTMQKTIFSWVMFLRWHTCMN